MVQTQRATWTYTGGLGLTAALATFFRDNQKSKRTNLLADWPRSQKVKSFMAQARAAEATGAAEVTNLQYSWSRPLNS